MAPNIAIGLIAPALLTIVPVRGRGLDPRATVNGCPAPVIRLREIAQYNLAAGDVSASSGGIAQRIGVEVPRGPLAVLGAPIPSRARGRRTASPRSRRGVSSGWNLTLTADAGVVGCRVSRRPRSTVRGLHTNTRASARPGRAGDAVECRGREQVTGAFAVTFVIDAGGDSSRADHNALRTRFDITPTDRGVTAAAKG